MCAYLNMILIRTTKKSDMAPKRLTPHACPLYNNNKSTTLISYLPQFFGLLPIFSLLLLLLLLLLPTSPSSLSVFMLPPQPPQTTLLTTTTTLLPPHQFVLPPSYAQTHDRIPDYNSPYAPIFTDKNVYTWTDRVDITIAAPSWNTNPDQIDDIGTANNRHIKLSTRGGFSLEPYKLTETGTNTGVFSGYITLTGFAHDADGDGRSDTTPKTSGGGPTNGFLETEHDSALTISFEFAKGVVITESVPISWNIGTIEFLNDTYTPQQNPRVRIVDPDMNLDPHRIDHINIDLRSDSILAGISIVAKETHERSGIFEASIPLDENSASKNRLFVKLGDYIYATYKDNTLPPPLDTSDSADITAKSRITTDIDPQTRSTIDSVDITDAHRQPLSRITVNTQAQITSVITNNQDTSQVFTLITQIMNADELVQNVIWSTAVLGPNKSTIVSQSWFPLEPGTYILESFAWDSLSSMNVIAKPTITTIDVVPL